MRSAATVAGILLATVVACARYEASATTDSARTDSVARARQDSINRAQPGYVVDSIFPIEEEIRRFNADLERPARLGGAANRSDLVRRFAAALRSADTSALRQLLITRAEFGHLVFPESPFTRAPYKAKPGVIWTQLMSQSQRGLSRLFARMAGSADISELRCDATPDQQGPNKLWRNCSVLVQSPEFGRRRMQLFGRIIERDGHAKFMSYASDF
jgi:hypothetical protein